MPTFTAIALERLLEPGASESVDKSVLTVKLSNSKPSNPIPERRNTESIQDRKLFLPQRSPALYATPEAIPLPDSPSSFLASPYIINHNGRGPCHSKSYSEDDMPSSQNAVIKETAEGNVEPAMPIENKHVDFGPVTCTKKGNVDVGCDSSVALWRLNGVNGIEVGSNSMELDDVSGDLEKENVLPQTVAEKSERESESEEFYDPRETMSFTSNSAGWETPGTESSLRFSTPMAEFYDAWEELSSDSGLHTSARNIESELREIRSTLLLEIEKRKQTEEALNHMRTYWLKLREQLGQVGLTLTEDPVAEADGKSLGRGIAKAEVETVMEAQLETKNFEISRLIDRLHYYEAVNHEMSQRNQEAVEMARRDGQRKKIRRRWICGSIIAAITLGNAALAWSYIPPGKPSSSAYSSDGPLSEDVSK